MGEGLGAASNLVGGLTSGYTTGRAQALSTRMQDSARLLKMADEYHAAAQDYADKPGQEHLYSLNMKAWAEAMTEASKLSGEKGRGAWKEMKGIFAHVLPGIVDDGKGQAQQPPPQIAMGVAQPAAQQPSPQTADAGGSALGALGMSGSDGGSTDQRTAPPDQSSSAPPIQPFMSSGSGSMHQLMAAPGQSMFQYVAANPAQSKQDIEQRATKGLQDYLGQPQFAGKNWDELRTMPEFQNTYLSKFLAFQKATGMDPWKVTETLRSPAEPMFTIPEGSPLAEYAPVGTKMPLHSALDTLTHLPDARKKLDNYEASLIDKVGRGTGTPEDKLELDRIQNLKNPATLTAEEQAWLASKKITDFRTPDGSKALLELNDEKIRRAQALQPDPHIHIYQNYDDDGQLFYTKVDDRTMKATKTETGIITNRAQKFNNLMLTRQNPFDGSITQSPNLGAIREALRTKRLSPDEAENGFLPYFQPEGPSKQNYEYLKGLIESTRSGKPFPAPPPPPTPAPTENKTGGFFNNILTPQAGDVGAWIPPGAPNSTSVTPGYAPPPSTRQYLIGQ